MNYISLQKGKYQIGDILEKKGNYYYNRFETFESVTPIKDIYELDDFFEVKFLDNNPEKDSGFTLVKKIELTRKVSLEEIINTDNYGDFSLSLSKVVKDNKKLLDKCLSQIFSSLKKYDDIQYVKYSIVDLLGKFFDYHNVENFNQTDEIVTYLEKMSLNNYWLLRFYHVLNGSFKERMYLLLKKNISSEDLDKFIESYDPYVYEY